MATSLIARELLIKVGYGHIACKMWGENISATQKFLGFHGWLDNAGTFDPLMKHFLNNDRCVVSVDLPGHGLSSHFPHGLPYSPASDLQAMRSVAKHLGWKNYHLLGHSMGAMRSQAYALCWPDEVQSVISLDGCMLPLHIQMYHGERSQVFTAYARQVDKFIGFSADYHRKDREHTWDELSERWLAAVPGLKAEDFAVLMKRGSTKLDNGSYVLNRDAALHNRTNILLNYPEEMLLEAFNKLTNTPQIIVNSSNFYISEDKHEKFNEVFVPFLDRLAANYPNKMEIVKFEGTHHVHMQKPAEVAGLIENFLTQVSEQTSQLPPVADS